MITIFICTDDGVAKEITKKYLNRDTLPYVNMIDGITYNQAVKKIESLEKEEEEKEEERGDLLAEGWTPVLIQDECLKDGDTFLVFVGFEKGDARERDMLTFAGKEELREFVDKYKLKFVDEGKFNKEFKAHRVSIESTQDLG